MRPILLLLVVCVGCTATSPTRAPSARTEHFVFHSDRLVNLHHFLYQCAKAQARRDGESVAGRPVEVAELEAVDALTGAEGDAWREALAFYRREAIGRDLLFDGRMHDLKVQLTGPRDDEGWPLELDPGFGAALRTALPVYLARFWGAHDSANHAWIDAAAAKLARHEAELVAGMTAAYGGHWPDPPPRVDVCAHANWAGAYTSGDPAHVTLSSSDPNGHGDGALEVLVHEASHTREMFGPLRTALEEACAARGAAPPRDLWHLLIFVTAGEVTRRTLAAAGQPGYEHYGDRTGLYLRGPWAAQRALLGEHWEAWLDGRLDRATALANIAAALSP